MERAPVHTADSTSPSAAEDGAQSSAGSAGVRGSTGNSSEDSALVLSPRATRSHASACARAQPHARGSAAHAGKLLLVTPPLAEFLGVSSDVPTLTRLQVPTHPPAYPGAAQDSPPIRFACATVNSLRQCGGLRLHARLSSHSGTPHRCVCVLRAAGRCQVTSAAQVAAYTHYDTTLTAVDCTLPPLQQ